MKATLTSKGQITIPILIRKKLDLKPGQELEFDLSAPFLKAVKSVDTKKTRALLGCLKNELSGEVSDLLDELRGKVELPKPKKRKSR